MVVGGVSSSPYSSVFVILSFCPSVFPVNHHSLTAIISSIFAFYSGWRATTLFFLFFHGSAFTMLNHFLRLLYSSCDLLDWSFDNCRLTGLASLLVSFSASSCGLVISPTCDHSAALFATHTSHALTVVSTCTTCGGGITRLAWSISVTRAATMAPW